LGLDLLLSLANLNSGLSNLHFLAFIHIIRSQELYNALLNLQQIDIKLA